MEIFDMLTACYSPNSFLRIVITVITVITLTGCKIEEEVSQAAAGNSNVSSENGGGSGPAIGSFSLSWTAPVTRQDGSPISLAEVDGYRVYYGDTPGVYPDSVDINNGAATATTVNNVPVGDYYIVMTTYDSDGRESTQSGVVSKQAL
jgi:hypothetical protein